MYRCGLALLGLVMGCGFSPYQRCQSAAAGDSLQCPTPGELDRAFDLHIPASWDGTSELPLIYVFHGGGGHRASANRVTCPKGDESDASCLRALASAQGYALVVADGTGNRPARNIRTWNAGGGGDWVCVSGAACNAEIDDMAYLDKVEREIEALLPIDPDRIYATGLSNGGAISHRLACERSERFAAIAAVGGANQFAAAGQPCASGSAVLQIHGTADPIWIYETSREGGVIKDNKLKVGAEDSTQAWAQRNGCEESPQSEDIPDLAVDGTSSTHLRYTGCEQAVELVRIEGGGHTWPQGFPYLSTDRIGLVAQDFDADNLILEFFANNPR